MHGMFRFLPNRRGPLALFVLLVAAGTVVVSVLTAGFVYWTVGPESYTWKHHLLIAAAIPSVVAPLVIFPLVSLASRLHATSERLRAFAFTDQLTGLPNVYALHGHLERETKAGKDFALHYVDIDKLKEVNNTLGHDAGDHFIQSTAKRLEEIAGESCYLARMGGDEFAVVQMNVSSADEAQIFARRLARDLSGSIGIRDTTVTVSVHIGIAMWPKSAVTARELLKAAHLAMHRACEADVQTQLFDDDLRYRAEHNRRLEQRLALAVRNRDFTLAFQPIYDSRVPGRIASVEALLRWEDADGSPVSPAEFIPIAERTGQILELGEWALHEACRQARRWPKQISLAVNISAVQFLKSDIPKLVRRALNETALPADRLTLEITESVLIGDVSVIGPQLDKLHALGVKLALDDFGSGYCGINYIRQFNVDKVKIDKTLIDEALKGPRAFNILSGVCRIAHDCGLVIVAEGLDSIEKLKMVNDLGVDEVQGYLLSRPVPASEITTLSQAILPRLWPSGAPRDAISDAPWLSSAASGRR